MFVLPGGSAGRDMGCPHVVDEEFDDFGSGGLCRDSHRVDHVQCAGERDAERGGVDDELQQRG